MINQKNLIFTNLYRKKSPSLASAKKSGDWKNTKQILALGKDKIIENIKDSGLRGRGGAGFSTGVKWSFMPKKTSRPHYLIINLSLIHI